MTMDGFVISALHRELAERLLPARVNRVYQPSPHDILLVLRQRGETIDLLLSSHPRLARVHIATRQRENPPSPPRFCLFLRKHLEGSQLIAIERPDFERILEFHFQARSELGNPIRRVLVLEVMGRHSNIILCQVGKILDSIRHVTAAMSRHRQVLPGKPYIPPPVQEKADPRRVRELTFYSLLQVWKERLPDALVRTFAGLSPLLAREMIYRARLDPDLVPGELDRGQLKSLWAAFSQLVESIEEGQIKPTVVLDGKGSALAFSILPLYQYQGCQQVSFSSISAAVEFYYQQQEKRQLLVARKQQLQGLVERELRRLSTTIARQEDSLAAMEEAEEYRRMGELLTANLFRFSPGARYVEVTDFYSPEGKKIKIPVDPTLSPAANVQRYFHRYRKAKMGRPHLEEQLARNRAERDYLEGIALALSESTTGEELADIYRELVSQGYLKEHKKKEAQEKAPPVVSRPLSFRSRDGFTILVGKNNRQNDYLTRRLASEHDYWLHAKDIPGSHVIIRCPPNRTPPPRTLEDAALLAAYFSKGRDSSQVAVDYTLVKNVRKPKGARPGMVIYDHYKTIFVTPDREQVKHLQQASPGEDDGTG